MSSLGGLPTSLWSLPGPFFCLGDMSSYVQPILVQKLTKSNKKWIHVDFSYINLGLMIKSIMSTSCSSILCSWKTLSRWPFTLKMLPSSSWSVMATCVLALMARNGPWVEHEDLVSRVELFQLDSVVMPSLCSFLGNYGIASEPFAPFIVPFLQEISGQHIPKGIHIDFKVRVVLS